MPRKPPSQRFLPNREKRGLGKDSDGGGVSYRKEAKEGTDSSDSQDDLSKGRSRKGLGKGKAPVTKTWEKVSVTALPDQVSSRAREALHSSLPGQLSLSSLPDQKGARKSSKGIPFAEQFPGHPRSKGGGRK